MAACAAARGALAFIVAPLVVLMGVSLYAEPEMRTLSFAQYAKFFGDVFNLSILRADAAGHQGDARVPGIRLSDRMDLRPGTAAASGLIVFATIIRMLLAERFAGLSRQLAK